jgi:transposase
MSLSMSLIWSSWALAALSRRRPEGPAYHPATLLKIYYVYGYLNRVQSGRRLERECQRNIKLV